MAPREARSRPSVLAAATVLSASTLLVLAASVPTSMAAALPGVGSTNGSAGSTGADARELDRLPFAWQPLSSGTFGNVIGVDVVSADVIWTSTIDTYEVMRSTDGGASFQDVGPSAGAEDFLQYYDIEAVSADEAILLSSGAGELSRVYRTTDGGESWDETFRATNPASFINCIAMFDSERGYAVGDPIDGKYQIMTTSDGGESWVDVDPSAIPDAQDGEYEWAASGACANASGKTAWFGTGNAAEARIIWSDDFGSSWNLSETPMPSGANAGIMGVDFRTNKLGLAVGGDFGTGTGGLVRTTDGGATWTLVADQPGALSTGIAWWQDKKGDERRAEPSPAQKTVFIVGPYGSEVSTDRGKTWTQFDVNSLNTVSCLKGESICIGGGPGGLIATLNET